MTSICQVRFPKFENRLVNCPMISMVCKIPPSRVWPDRGRQKNEDCRPTPYAAVIIIKYRLKKDKGNQKFCQETTIPPQKANSLLTNAPAGAKISKQSGAAGCTTGYGPRRPL